MAAHVGGLAPAGSLAETPPPLASTTVRPVTATGKAGEADEGRVAVAVGEPSAAMYGQPSCWWWATSPCTATRSCKR